MRSLNSAIVRRIGTSACHSSRGIYAPTARYGEFIVEALGAPPPSLAALVAKDPNRSLSDLAAGPRLSSRGEL